MAYVIQLFRSKNRHLNERLWIRLRTYLVDTVTATQEAMLVCCTVVELSKNILTVNVKTHERSKTKYST